MIVESETTVSSAVKKAIDKSSLTAGRDDIDYREISVDQYNPIELDFPDEEEIDLFSLYEITVYTDEGAVTGYGIKNNRATYGQPVTVEVHTDDV